MTPTPRDHSPLPGEAGPNAQVRSIASLLLFLHLFCLFLALSGNYFISQLQIGVLNAPIVAPYLQFFKIRPAAPYHLTDGTEVLHDHFVEVEVVQGPRQGEVTRLPDSSVGASPVARRAALLARTMGVTSYFGAEQNTSAFAKALGARALGSEDERVVVRCIRFEPQIRVLDTTNPANPADPTAAAYRNTVYSANVWRDRRGQVQLLKDEENKRDVAPVE